MKKTLKENSLLGIFQLDGTPAEQKQLKQLVEEVLNTKSGRQLVEDIGNIDFIPKPIKLFFVPKEQLPGEGQANAEEGTIRLTPVVPDHYFSKVSILAHELCHLRNGEVLTKILHKCSIPQQVYAPLPLASRPGRPPPETGIQQNQRWLSPRPGYAAAPPL